MGTSRFDGAPKLPQILEDHHQVTVYVRIRVVSIYSSSKEAYYSNAHFSHPESRTSLVTNRWQKFISDNGYSFAYRMRSLK